ncbi:MAG TPA: inositol monophosphatase [candidate division Zixibacteria bacterium]|nr:inositol monophosphatase [candidate division Zixibacteria bacterium]
MISTTELKRLTGAAKAIAISAGQILLKKSKKRHRVMLKGRVDLVTDADLASEKYIVGEITKKFPNHSILAEEEAARDNHSDYRWVIDPLDGTTNFAHDFPFYCVSIGIEYRGDIIAGVVYDPERDELFHAFKGGGAYQNRKKINVSAESNLERALLATGFPYDIGNSREDNLKYFRRFAKKARGIRRAGSAALDLCYLACGRFDGFWELKLHPWDTAAGKIIIEEAGGVVTDFDGKKYSIYGKYILAGNPKIHRRMKKILAE